MRLPAVWVLGLWFVIQFISTLGADMKQGGVACAAHVGGCVAGMLLVALFRRRDVRLFAGRRPSSHD